MQSYSGLDFAASDGVFLVVVSQAGGLGGDALKQVVHEGVHDAHGLAGDTGVGVNLLQHLVDVDGVALLARLSPLLGISSRLGLRRRLLLSLHCCHFSRHGYCKSSDSSAKFRKSASESLDGTTSVARLFIANFLKITSRVANRIAWDLHGPDRKLCCDPYVGLPRNLIGYNEVILPKRSPNSHAQNVKGGPCSGFAIRTVRSNLGNTFSTSFHLLALSCLDVEREARPVPRPRLALAVQGSSSQSAVFTVSSAVATMPRGSVLALQSTLQL